MKPIAGALYVYGFFLILAGLAGYLSNPEKAKTALFSGGTFGMISLALGWLTSRGWPAAPRVALGMAGFLGLVFIWRSTVTWVAYAGGKPEKLIAASIISAMLLATLLLIRTLVRARGARMAGHTIC